MENIQGGISVSKVLRKAASILCMVVLILSMSVPAFAVSPDSAKETAESSSSGTTEEKTETATEEQTATQKPKPTTASEKTDTEKKGDSEKPDKVHKKKKLEKKKKKDKKKKDKKKKKEKKIEAPEESVSVRSKTALDREKKLKRQLMQEESLQQGLMHTDKVKEEIQKFYAALEEQSGSVTLPGVVALTGVKKDGDDTQIGHRVNHLLMELAQKTKNRYLKDIARNYNFDVAGEVKVADVIQEEETIQLKQYLDQQLLNCDKTQEQRIKDLKKSRKKIQALKKQIKELNADKPRIFDPMDLLKKSNLSVEEIRLMLKGTALEEQAPAFYKCEKTYGVNAVMVMGIAIHESAWGTSRRAREDHNLTGYGVTSDSAKGINAPTKEENLMMTAKLLKEKYLVKGGAYYHGPTVKGVNQNYCVGNTWAGYVTNRCYEIMKKL